MQIVRFRDKLLYPLNHLIGPVLRFETEFHVSYSNLELIS